MVEEVGGDRDPRGVDFDTGKRQQQPPFEVDGQPVPARVTRIMVIVDGPSAAAETLWQHSLFVAWREHLLMSSGRGLKRVGPPDWMAADATFRRQGYQRGDGHGVQVLSLSPVTAA